MKIGKVQTTSDIFLAPMAGVTDIGFRKICKDMGAGLTYTEMVSVKGLYYGNQKTKQLLEINDNERPVAVQLFGSDPNIFKCVLQDGLLDKFDIIDINMGCPAPKITKNGDGSSLLKNIPLAREIIMACVESTDKPVTVKFRMGYDLDQDIAVPFAKMCEMAGASAICIHPRTREQFYSGKADWDVITKVKQAVTIPVIANGDVVDQESYNQILKTGCDAVMIGRGALGNPEIFATLLGRTVNRNKLDIIQEHLDILSTYYHDEKSLVTNFRKHLLWYVSNNRNASKIKLQLMQYETIDEIMTLLKQYFES